MIDEESLLLRQLYEATENEFVLKTQLALKKGTSRIALLEQLRSVNDKSIDLLKKVTPHSKLVDTTKKMNNVLLNSANKSFLKGNAAIKKLTRTQPLADAIYKQTQQGIDKGLNVRVGGKNWSYKAYMEMNVRTTIQQEIGEQQLESGKNARVVFYICNEFGDCADDHKDWQGKIYYDERYKSFNLKTDKIDNAIKSKGMKSMQWVMGKPVYLTTRPNCRHNFTPLSIDQVLTQEPKVLLNALKLKTGTYKPENYDALQTQRYNERMIRKYRDRADMNEQLGYDNTQDNMLVRQWQARQRQLVKANPALERDYRRESNKVLLTDLGAKYNKGNMPVMNNVPPTPAPPVVPIKEDVTREYKRPRAFDTKREQKAYDKWVSMIKKDKVVYKDVHDLLDKADVLFDDNMKIVLGTAKSYHVSYRSQRNFVTGEPEVVETILKVPNIALDKVSDGKINTFTHEYGHMIDQSITKKLLEKENGGRVNHYDLTLGSELYKKKKYDGDLGEIQLKSENLHKAIQDKYVTRLKNHEKVDFFEERTPEVKKILDETLAGQKAIKADYAAKSAEVRQEYKEKYVELDKLTGSERWAGYKKLIKDRKKADNELSLEQDSKIREEFGAETGMQDIYDAVTGGFARDRGKVMYGHGSKYYNNTGTREAEIYANYVSISVHKPELIEILRKDIPEIIESCEELTKTYLKVVEKL